MLFSAATISARRAMILESLGGRSMRLYPQAAQYRLTLTGFEPRILLVDHVHAARAADDAAVLIALLERTEGVADLHDTAFWSLKRPSRPSFVEARKLCKGLPPVNP